MKNLITFFCLSFFLFSCKNDQKKEVTESAAIIGYDKIKIANWLIGNWENKTSDGILTENWEIKNDSVFSAISYFISERETTDLEIITIEENNRELFYIPIVKNQNNNQPVKFKLTLSNQNQMVFENPEHDFPQKITYTKINNDSLVAEISGMIKGKANSQKFLMKKVK